MPRASLIRLGRRRDRNVGGKKTQSYRESIFDFLLNNEHGWTL